ncbi:hypothetical protein DL96DRAFT_1455720 [Flagelloscypha sp. PMI_526]|nr:hypothetical protein DL96DRAFT_1455720 [Flagelloscypha sp. PMI_526]
MYKNHRLPKPSAAHPSDRWESLFISSFIQKFHPNLRAKIDNWESCMDLENALVSSDGDDILQQILVAFITKLKPTTRNLAKEQLTSTFRSLLSEAVSQRVQTVFWDEGLQKNVDPFENNQSDIFSATWDVKLNVLRQLVELQLMNSTEVKSIIDRAWGANQNKNKKKGEKEPLPPPPKDDPMSKESLHYEPLGQDIKRKRYWVVDDSPRVYQSSNPWKIGASFEAICSTKDEYVKLIEKLEKEAPPEPGKGERLGRFQAGHVNLIKDLKARESVIDAELLRIQKARKRLDQKLALQTQAELRQTRTRRQTTKAQYNFDDFAEEDDGDEYNFQDEEDIDDGFGFRRGSSSMGVRRSTRNGGTIRNDSPAFEWRGERRSTRLGATTDMVFDEEPPRKRARTEESTSSIDIDTLETVSSSKSSDPLRAPKKGAAALKSNEIAMETVGGKKKSKFWVYAVESVGPGPNDSGMDVDPPSSNGNGNGIGNGMSVSGSSRNVSVVSES